MRIGSRPSAAMRGHHRMTRGRSGRSLPAIRGSRDTRPSMASGQLLAHPFTQRSLLAVHGYRDTRPIHTAGVCVMSCSVAISSSAYRHGQRSEAGTRADLGASPNLRVIPDVNLWLRFPRMLVSRTAPPHDSFTPVREAAFRGSLDFQSRKRA